MAMIFKIFRSHEFAAFEEAGETSGAPIDVADGYVHFSTAEQVAETAAKHFSGETNLKLLALDSDRLGSKLKWEPSRGGALFPHLYRKLVAADVLWAKDLPLGSAGHEFEGLLP